MRVQARWLNLSHDDDAGATQASYPRLRADDCVRLWESGLSFCAIGERVGISHQQAHRLVHGVLERLSDRVTPLEPEVVADLVERQRFRRRQPQPQPQRRSASTTAEAQPALPQPQAVHALIGSDAHG